MTNWRRFATLTSAGVCLAGIAFCHAPVAESAQRGGAVFYVPVPSTDFGLMAERYDVYLMTERGWRVDLLRAAKPDAEVYRYNSATDTYITGPNTDEHDYLVNLAAQKGWDPEDAYLHYWDDTVIALQGSTVTIPGWGGGSAVSKAEARVPVYYSNLSRRAVNVSTYRGAQLNKETMVHMGIDEPFYLSAEHADGIFLDNMGTNLWNTGTIESGGHVLEAPGHALIGSPEFQDWHWHDVWAPFLADLKDTLEIASTWGPDGRNKKVMINNSSSWDEAVPSQDVADIFFLEYQYSPIRNAGDHWVQNAINRDREAAQTGGVMFYSAKPVTSASGYQGSVSVEEAKLGNYAWYLVTKTEESIFFQADLYNAGDPEYPVRNWAGCMDVARERFGDALGEPQVLATGTDPRGYAYKVYAREYEGGLALLRNRGAWNQHIDAATAVTITLPESMIPVAPDGSLGAPTQTATLANGRGALFVREDGSTGDGTGPDPVDDIEFAFRVLATSPDHGSLNVPAATEIRWFMSQAFASPVQDAWVDVSGSISGNVNGTLELAAGGRMLVFRPSLPLTPGETVTARLSAQSRRFDQEPLDGNLDGVGSATPADDDVTQFVVSP